MELSFLHQNRPNILISIFHVSTLQYPHTTRILLIIWYLRYKNLSCPINTSSFHLGKAIQVESSISDRCISESVVNRKESVLDSRPSAPHICHNSLEGFFDDSQAISSFINMKFCGLGKYHKACNIVH